MIRVARSDDVAALAQLNLEVQRLHLAAMPQRYRDPTAAEVEAHLRELLADADIAILVAEDAGALVGFAVVRRVEIEAHVFARARRAASVDALGVAAGARRGGHGRALMAAAENQARAWGATALVLDVQAFNAEAADFYRALGYAPATVRMSRTL
jgi:ribosomal protein S18 acetylase RimI-like enzyme